MSLICANCHKEIVVSDHPTHYGFCAACSNTMSKEDRDHGIAFIDNFRKVNGGEFQK